MPDVTKQKLAAYERTPETRAKMSAAAKARKRSLRDDSTQQKIAGKTPERMRKPGTKGAPTSAAFKSAAKTAKPMKRKAK